MGYPLTDITIYFTEVTLGKDGKDNPYRIHANYLCDLYHSYLNSYKPPKTGRICLHLVSNKQRMLKPCYTGCILSCYAFFDADEFVSKTSQEQQLFLLNILHETIMGVAHNLSWNEAVFAETYVKCIENNFQLIKEYPAKKSRDTSITASVVIKKNEQTTYTYIKVASATDTRLHKAFETANNYCYDMMYGLAKRAKWIDKDRFGFSFKNGRITISYCMEKNIVKIDMDPKIETMDELLDKYDCLIKATTERVNINPFYLGLLNMISKLPDDKRQIELDKIKSLL